MKWQYWIITIVAILFFTAFFNPDAHFGNKLIHMFDFDTGREISPQNACINNLRLIDGAKQQWALENKKVSSSIPTMNDLRRYLARDANWFPTCLSGGKYSPNAVTTAPTCTITNHWLP